MSRDLPIICMFDANDSNSVQIDIYSQRQGCVVLQLNGTSWQIPRKGDSIEVPFRLPHGEVIPVRGVVWDVEHEFGDLAVGTRSTWLQKITVRMR